MRLSRRWRLRFRLSRGGGWSRRLALRRRLLPSRRRWLSSRGRSAGLLLTRRLTATSSSQILRRNFLDFRPGPLLFSILKLVPYLFDHVRRDRGSVVSPIGSNISQNRSKLLIGVLTFPGLHGIIKWFPLDLYRSLQAFEHDRNELICRITCFHLGTGQGRILPGNPSPLA